MRAAASGPNTDRKPSRFSQVTTAIMQTAIVPKAARSRRLIHPGGRTSTANN
jgi:hypothetical protein